MPCSQRKARLLLKQKKAKIISYKPFTIQLCYATGESKQEVTVGIDEGARHIGIAVVSQGKVLAKGEVELRQDVHSLLLTRAQYRRGRRFRKTRYRKTRFLNRRKVGSRQAFKQNWTQTSHGLISFAVLCLIQNFV